MLRDWFISLRPQQWIKNLFVFAALIFAEKFTDWPSVERSLVAFVVFCFAASGVYLINDVVDIEKDRLHPIKKQRPLAAGKIGRSAAPWIGCGLMIISLLAAWSVNERLATIIFLYLVLNLAYSFYLKRVEIVDVLCVAMGFVLRVIGGAVAIQVIFSDWLLLCTFFLTLFLAISKRRNELVNLGVTEQRVVLGKYSLRLLEQMNAVVLPATLISYALYTLNSVRSRWLILTVPVVLFGLLRYLLILDQKKIDDDGPTGDLLKDRPLQFVLLLWIFLVVIILVEF
ncbi:MAG: decaprenyl-phosphate phosphoribosyltransferase [Candidatus Magasanikbacteria bacterium]|nr:decaprenyl-phosphate phosphoribosyltransferase [Candidatus Magasanikbacteria bacterium]